MEEETIDITEGSAIRKLQRFVRLSVSVVHNQYERI